MDNYIFGNWVMMLAVRVLCIGVGFAIGRMFGYKRGFADGVKLKKK